MKLVKDYGKVKVYEVRGKYLIRIPGMNQSATWKLYNKYTEGVLRDFCYSSSHIADIMAMMNTFDEEYNTVIVEEAYPEHIFNSTAE